jgi:hypothetical protein
VLATVFTLPPKPAGNPCATGVDFAPGGQYSLDIYSADAGGAAKQISHQTFAEGGPTPSILFFAGWDATGPLGTYPSEIGTQGGGPTHYFGSPVRTDLAGKVLGALGGADCNASDDLPDGTVACALSAGESVRRTDGSELWHGAQSIQAGRLSPDARRVAGLGDSGQVALGADGSVANLFGEFFVAGWLDNVTVIGNFAGGEIGIQKVAPLGTGTGQGYKGSFVGVVQRP